MIVKAIATHTNPHLDEIVALWLALSFGGEVFEGIHQAKLHFWGQGQKTPDGRPVAEWEAEGWLILGMAESTFDEHAGRINGGQKNECCATLMAKHLGISRDDPWFVQILDATYKSDTTANTDPMGLPSLIQKMYSYHTPKEVIDWAIQAIETLYERQKDFVVNARRIFDEQAQIVEFEAPTGKTVKLAAIEADGEQLLAFGLSPKGGNCQIIIQKHVTGRQAGNVQILVHSKARLKMNEVVKLLRIREQEASGNILVTEWDQLESAGVSVEKDPWFFHEASQGIFNGSRSAQNVPATQLSLDEVIHCVMVALDKTEFAEKFKAECLKGRCQATEENRCPFYHLGLRRCRGFRSFQKSEQGKQG